ncbi:MAG: tellurite resistance TerB family protein [Devosia sp.]
MPLSTQDGLIYLMVISASSDEKVSDRELSAIQALVSRLPVFDGYEKGRLAETARNCLDLVKDSHSFDKVIEMVLSAIPERLHDTAYALAVEVATIDLRLAQEELRLLEDLRDRLKVDSLVAAAIEASARARLRRA